MEHAVGELLAVPVEGLDVDQLRAELEVLQVARRRIDARIARGVAAVHAAEVASARADAPDDARAGERMARQVRRELADRLGMSPSRVKAARAVGDRLAASPVLADAVESGRVSGAHARVLDRTLKSLSGDARRSLEAELVAAAADGMRIEDFSKLARRGLAELDRVEAEAAEARRHRARRAALVQTEDGMTALHGQWAGLQAEIVNTAVHAFRRPDADGEHRTAEQRTADAVVDALQAALRAGQAPTNHGVRPHLVLTVDADTVMRAALRPARQAGVIPGVLPGTGGGNNQPGGGPGPGAVPGVLPGGRTAGGLPGGRAAGETVASDGNATIPAARDHLDLAPGAGTGSGSDIPDVLGSVIGDGIVDGAWTGPMLWSRVRQVLDDSAVSFLAIGDDLPVAVTSEVRTVPAAVWRGLVHRDRGCIHPTCDLPANWCQVMHLDVPYIDGGRLSFGTGALGCTFHHRQYDNGQLELAWEADRPVLRPPRDGPP